MERGSTSCQCSVFSIIICVVDLPVAKSIITGRNEVVAKVMFLHVSVILLTEGGAPENSPQDQADPPGRENPPPTREKPPRTRENPPPGRKLQHTVNERPVRILLECILVLKYFRSHGVDAQRFTSQLSLVMVLPFDYPSQIDIYKCYVVKKVVPTGWQLGHNVSTCICGGFS